MESQNKLLITVKTMKPYSGFWRIFRRPSCIIRFVHELPIFLVLTRSAERTTNGNLCSRVKADGEQPSLQLGKRTDLSRQDQG